MVSLLPHSLPPSSLTLRGVYSRVRDGADFPHLSPDGGRSATESRQAGSASKSLVLEPKRQEMKGSGLLAGIHQRALHSIGWRYWMWK